jgi:putative glutamine amidotransferase
VNNGRRPLIGISSYSRSGDRRSFSLPGDYVDVVRDAGGIPVILPCAEDCVPETIEMLGGLILSGGGDVDPLHYGATPHEANYGICTERDGFELALARAAVARSELPILCICRGMQVMNVALGGDLVQHIPDHFGDGVPHRMPERTPVEHPVRIESGSRVASILGTTELAVRSWHHQAVGRLGAGLRAVAWSPDGVVEALESDTHPFTVGVQWHPESCARGNPCEMGLFDALVRAARARNNGG